MLPECFAFFEVGPKFIHSQHREQLMEVQTVSLCAQMYVKIVQIMQNMGTKK